MSSDARAAGALAPRPEPVACAFVPPRRRDAATTAPLGNDDLAPSRTDAPTRGDAATSRLDLVILVKAGRWDDAAALLAQLIATSEHAIAVRTVTAPESCERLSPRDYVQLAIMLRKQQRYEDEIAACDRYLRHAAGGPHRELAARRARAEELIRRSLV